MLSVLNDFFRNNSIAKKLTFQFEDFHPHHQQQQHLVITTMAETKILISDTILNKSEMPGILRHGNILINANDIVHHRTMRNEGKTDS